MTARTLPKLDPRFIYLADTVASTIMGLALVVGAQPLTRLAGWNMPSSFLSIVGLFLLPWAAFNFWVARRIGPILVRSNIAGDALWVLGTGWLVSANMASLSQAGMALLIGQGVAVAGVLAIKLAGARALA